MPRWAKRAEAAIFKNICDFLHFPTIFCIILIIFCGKFLMSFVKFRNKLKITLKFSAFLTVLAYFLRFIAYLFVRSQFFPYIYHLLCNFPLIFSIFLFFPRIFPFFTCFSQNFSLCQRIFPISGGFNPPNPPLVTPLQPGGISMRNIWLPVILKVVTKFIMKSCKLYFEYLLWLYKDSNKILIKPEEKCRHR